MVACYESNQAPENGCECFFEVYEERGLKVNAEKSKVMLLGENDGSIYSVFVNGS